MQRWSANRSIGVLNIVLFASCFPVHSAVITSYSSAAGFGAAATNLATITFEGLAPNNSFTNYLNSGGGLTTNGVNFFTSGTGPFGPGFVSVSGAGYAAGLPLENVMSGALLVWTPPNQPGTAFLNANLPAGITAVATNLWAMQPFAATAQITVTAGGATQTFPLATSNRVANVSSNPTFFGVTSNTPITSLQFGIPAGEVGLMLDNFSIGQAAVGPSPSVPEPSTIILIGTALLGIAFLRSVKKSRGRF